MTGPIRPLETLRMLTECQPAGIFLSESHGEQSFRSLLDEIEEWQNTLAETPVLFSASSPEMCTSVFAQTLACFERGIPIVLQNQRLPSEAIHQQQKWVSERLDEIEPKASVLLFTSGSSGKPKAVVHTPETLWASAVSSNRHAPLHPGGRWLCPLPLYHVGGLAIFFRCLDAGATVCRPSGGTSLAEAVRELRPTHLSLVPTQLYRWLQDPDFTAEGIKRVLIGGAALPEKLRILSEARGLPLATSYGMTETASQITATPPGKSAVGSGELLPHVQIRISEEGEIRVKAESLAVGILGEEGMKSMKEPDGWFHTRDRGRLEDGVLHVEGRMDLQFISGGENIQPEAIERALLELDGISEALVAPVEDEEFGQRPCAWVDAEPTEVRIREWNQLLRKQLPGYMIPVTYRQLPPAQGMKRRRGDL